MPRIRNSQKAGTSKQTQNPNVSQTTLEQSFSKSQKVIENVDELVNNCVRYVLYRAGNNFPIRRSDIQKHVLQNVGKKFDQILSKAVTILNDVYGYNLYLSDEPSSIKQYLVSNVLPYKPEVVNVDNNESREDDDEIKPPSDVNKILIMLVLTHIFMSNNNVSEASLFTFLRSLHIDPDESHDLFGNVRDFITTMVKQKYLSTEIEPVMRRVSYMWGPKAEWEVSKHELLKFVCKMYKDRTPKTWTSQYEKANVQARSVGVQNGTEDDVEEMSS